MEETKNVTDSSKEPTKTEEIKPSQVAFQITVSIPPKAKELKKSEFLLTVDL